MTSANVRKLSLFERYLSWRIDRIARRQEKVSEKKWNKHHEKHGW